MTQYAYTVSHSLRAYGLWENPVSKVYRGTRLIWDRGFTGAWPPIVDTPLGYDERDSKGV